MGLLGWCPGPYSSRGHATEMISPRWSISSPEAEATHQQQGYSDTNSLVTAERQAEAAGQIVRR